MSKQIAMLFLLLALAIPMTLQAEIRRFLRVGLDPNYPPLESKNSRGELTGFDIDLIDEICRRIQTKCIYVEREFDDFIPALKAGEIDAIISALSITEQRKQEIAFSEKLYASDARLVALKGSRITPDIPGLQGRRIGLVRGSTEQIYAEHYWRFQGVSIISYANQNQVYYDLLSGWLDAAFQDELAVQAGFLNRPLGKHFSFAGPSVRKGDILGEGTAVGLPKADAGLKQAIDHAIVSMRRDGTYNQLVKKHFD